ncbi:MAG: transposase [Okeania sp. SIO2D1]|nr:transposase [Okeania sp. SIO2D1]
MVINHCLKNSIGTIVFGWNQGQKNQTLSVPKFYRKSQSNLARKQKKVSRKEIGSNNWRAAQNRIARLHQYIARQREDFHVHYCS